MATVVAACGADQIGETAGAVWRCLDENGSMSLAKLARNVDAPRDTVMQAVGWLARVQDYHRRNEPRQICRAERFLRRSPAMPRSRSLKLR